MFALIIYPLLRFWVKSGLRLFYRKITVLNEAQADIDGPVIYCANHPNTLLDALLLTCFIKGRPWFLVRSDVFAKPALAKFFNGLHMMPIYRVRDGFGSLKKNEAIFERCVEVLKQGGKVILFPEGSHSSEPKVRKFQKGVERLYEMAKDANPALINVGIHYQAPAKIFTKVVLNFGGTIPAENGLHEVMESRMKDLVPHIENPLYVEKKEIYNHVQRLKLLPHFHAGRLGLTQKLNAMSENDLQALLIDVRKSKKVLNEEGVRFFRPTSRYGWLSELFLCVCSIPVFLIGKLIRVPSRLVVSNMVKKAKDPHFHATLHFFLGLLVNTIVLLGIFIYFQITTFSWLVALFIWFLYAYSVWFSIVWEAKWNKVKNMRANRIFAKKEIYTRFSALRENIKSRL